MIDRREMLKSEDESVDLLLETNVSGGILVSKRGCRGVHEEQKGVYEDENPNVIIDESYSAPPKKGDV